MPYEVELPDGTIIEGIPDDMPQAEVRKKILSAYPDLEDYKPQATPAQSVAGGGNGILSTIGNVTGSILPGLVTGVGNVLQQPKQLMELAGSKFGVEKENIPDIGYLNTAGKGLESLGQYMMPEAIKKGLESGQQVGDVADLQAQKEFNDSWINKALPQVTELAQKFNLPDLPKQIYGSAFGIYATVKEMAVNNPEVLPAFIAQQAPQMAIPLGVGKAGAGATTLLGGSKKLAAAVGVNTAVATGAIMQGTDVAYDTFEETFAKLKAQGVEEAEAEQRAMAVARDAFFPALAISLATQKLVPGGQSLERAVLSGKPIKPIGVAKATLGEGGTELPEEYGGKVAGNIAQQKEFPDLNPLSGAGTAGGLGFIGGVGAGGAASMISRARTPKTVDDGTTLGATPPAPEVELSPEALAGLQPATITSSSGPVTVSYPNPNAGQPMLPPDGTAPPAPPVSPAPVDYRGFPTPPTNLPAGVQPAALPTEPELDTSKTFPVIERGVEGATLPNVEFGTPGGMHNAIAQRLRLDADTLGISPLIYDKLQQGKSVKQIANDLKAKLTFLPESGRTNFVNQVHKTFGPVEKTKAEDTAPVETTTDAQDIQLFEPQTPGAVQGPALPKVNIGNNPTDMVNQVAQTMRREADQKGLTAYIADQSAKGRSAKQIANSYGFASKLEFLPSEQRHNYVRQVQATLGYGPIAQRWGVNVNQPTVPSRGRNRTKTSSQPAGVDTTVEPTVVDEGGVGGVDATPAGTTTGKTTEPPTLTKRAPKVTGFKTSKGSEYVVDESGKTSRTKKSPGKGQGETYPPHTAVYVSTAIEEDMRDEMRGLMGNGSIRIGYLSEGNFKGVSSLDEIPNSQRPFVAVIDKRHNVVVAYYLASVKPSVGLHPVEKLYNNDGTSNTHLGNDITEISTAPTKTTAIKTKTPTDIAPRDVISDFDLNPPEDTPTKVDIDSIAPPVDPSPTAPVTVTPPAPRAIYMALAEGINGSANIKDPALRDLLIEKKLVNKDGITEAGSSFKKVFDGKIFDKKLGFVRNATPKDANDLFSDIFGGREGKFEVGDSVRIGNTLGTVIGVSEDYVQFRPVNATNKKASQKVPIYAVEFVSRPNTSSESSASKRIQKGSFEFNKDEVLENLGQNMYGSALANVSVKELLQNAFDGVKSAIYNGIDKGKYKVGKIDIVVNHNDRTVTVHDDSIGMSPDILQKAFFTVGGSDKQNLPPELRSGGFGLAKVGFMVSTESMKVVTISDGVQSTVDASSRDIRASNFDIVIEDAPKNKHGTTVTVKIPETFKDKKGEDQHIWFPYSADSVDILNKPLLGDVEVTFTIKTAADSEGTKVTVPIGVNTNFKKTPKLTTATFSWGTADIYLGVERIPDGSYGKHRVLSSGVYQFDANFKLNEKEKIPFDVIVDIKPNVKASDIDYPFENSRERFKSRIDADIKSLQGFLQQIVRADDAKNLQDGFKNIVSMPRIDPNNVTNNDKNELKFAFKNKGTSTGDTNTTYTAPTNIVIGEGTVRTPDGKVIVKENVKESTFTVDKEAVKPTDFLIDIKQDPKLPILHNNLNVDLIEVGEKAGGDPKLFFAELGSIFVEMKEELANSGMWGYNGLSPDNLFFAGISLDKSYGGMIIKVPYKSLFLNPFFSFGQRTIFGERNTLLRTMIHEIAHIADMDHGVGHNQEQIKVENYLEDTGLMDYYRDAILTTLQKHYPAYEAMKNEFNKSTTRNIAKSFEEGQKGSASRTTGGSTSGPVNQPRPVPARGGRGGGSNLPAPSGTSTTSPINTGTTGKPAKLRAGQPGPLSINSSNPTFNPLAKANAPVGKEGGYRETPFGVAARKLANWHQPIRSLENVIDLSGKLVYSGADVNAFATILAAAAAKGVNYYRGNMANLVEAIHEGINDYAKSAGISIDKALENMHLMAEALHEPERRAVKYLLTVPLDTAKNLTQNGKAISAADRRNDIMDLLNKYKLTEAQARALRAELDSLVANHADPLGYSPRRDAKNGGVTGAMPVDINAEIYKVSVMDASDVVRITQEYNADKNKVLIDAILDNVQKLNKRILDANKISNYVSTPVANRIAFYGWTDYVPLKGFNEHPAKSPIDDEIDIFAGNRLSKELQETEFAFDARDTVSNNPITQVTVEAIRASARAGRGSELTLSIMNAVKQGYIKGKIEKNIPFEEREEALKDALKKNVVLHYNKDGSVDVIRVYDELILNSLRRSYNDTSPLWNLANFITGAIGKSMTRWNYTFAPMNYVRDILTNAWLMAVEGNPIEAAKFLAIVAARTITNPHTATRVAYLYENNKFAELNALAKRSGFARDMIEYIENGGMQSYSDTMSVGNKVKALEKKLGRGLVLKTSDEFGKVIDIYNNVFELTSRAAAYGVMKSKYMHGSRKMNAKDAAIKAAVEVKNYANFEQMGERGRELGALFMFGRATATGATRALESIAPAFDLVLPPQWKEANKLPKSIRDDPVALATFKKNFRKKQLASTVMVGGLIGAGMYLFGMIAAGAPEDELGRNKVLTDDLDQWTRYLRMPVADGKFPESMGKNVVFQMPFGLGNGAFVGVGVQIAANDAGVIDKKQMFKNISTILLDAFLPFPTSKMDISKNPAQFAIDTATPTAIRTITQSILNKDGLGRDIVPLESRGNKMGAAYSGSESTPQMYKDAAMALANVGGPNINPNSLLHFFTNYVNGIAKIAEEAYDMLTPPDQRKAFNPHKDMGPLSSFFGTPSNADARNFSKLRDEMDDITKRTNMFKLNPDKRNEYEVTNNGYIVSMWEKDLNGQLKALQQQAKSVRESTIGEFTPAQREIILKDNTFAQNLVKKNLIDKYKQLGVKF